MASAETLTVFLKLLAAGFYGVSSFLIVVVNKSVLTNYRYGRAAPRPGSRGRRRAPAPWTLAPKLRLNKVGRALGRAGGGHAARAAEPAARAGLGWGPAPARSCGRPGARSGSARAEHPATLPLRAPERSCFVTCWSLCIAG